MTTNRLRCNSLKPKKLPNETRAPRSSLLRYEPQVCGMKFNSIESAPRRRVDAPSQACNPQGQRAMLMREMKVGKREGARSLELGGCEEPITSDQ
jgi:hypothetical protein